MLFFFVCWRVLRKRSRKNNGYIKRILLKSPIDATNYANGTQQR